MKSEYEDRQWNLKPGEIYMIRRHFKQADGRTFSYYEWCRIPEWYVPSNRSWSPDDCTWFGSYENALAYVRRKAFEYGTWEIVKMIPIPRDKDGLEIITFKGAEKPPTD
jgi:hypothetical protein